MSADGCTDYLITKFGDGTQSYLRVCLDGSDEVIVCTCGWLGSTVSVASPACRIHADHPPVKEPIQVTHFEGDGCPEHTCTCGRSPAYGCRIHEHEAYIPLPPDQLDRAIRAIDSVARIFTVPPALIGEAKQAFQEAKPVAWAYTEDDGCFVPITAQEEIMSYIDLKTGTLSRFDVYAPGDSLQFCPSDGGDCVSIGRSGEAEDVIEGLIGFLAPLSARVGVSDEIPEHPQYRNVDGEREIMFNPAIDRLHSVARLAMDGTVSFEQDTGDDDGERETVYLGPDRASVVSYLRMVADALEREGEEVDE